MCVLLEFNDSNLLAIFGVTCEELVKMQRRRKSEREHQRLKGQLKCSQEKEK